MLSQLLNLVQWISNSAPIVFVRDSKYGMPAVQSVHLVGITVLLATVLMLDLRLAGLAMMESPLSWVEQQLKPWATAALTLVILSGVLIFLGTPLKYLASNPFRLKMALLALAVFLHVGVLRRFVVSGPGAHTRRGHVMVAALSVTVWFLVGWAGRAIAFVP